MKWQRIVERLGKPQTTEGLASDPFFYLGSCPGPKARISVSIGRSLAYGDFKASVTVTIECPQNEEHINIAAEIADDKAKELVDDVFCAVATDVQRLPRTYE
jgi:hypothetical protein